MIDWDKPYDRVYGMRGVTYEQNGKFYREDGHEPGYEPPKPQEKKEKPKPKDDLPAFIHNKPIRKKAPIQMTAIECQIELDSKGIKYPTRIKVKDLREMVSKSR